LIIETLDFARLVRAYVCLWAVSVIKLARELADKDARRAFDATQKSLRTERLPHEWAEIAFFVAFFVMITAVAGSRDHTPSIVEQARLVRNHPPPPCVSDGDGGVWVDTGERYVRQGDENYARLRRDLCGY
jgi:hypothetical protein